MQNRPTSPVLLSRFLLKKGARRATQLRCTNVEKYLSDLIRQDLAGVTNESTTPQTPANGTTHGRLFPVDPLGIKRQSRGKSAVALRKQLLVGMVSHMNALNDPGFGYACSYRLKHVDRCAAITRDFLKRLEGLAKKDASKKMTDEVKRVVLKLNKLNTSCGGALIETDQRELLCQFIFAAAQKAGALVDHDITAKFRSW